MTDASAPAPAPAAPTPSFTLPPEVAAQLARIRADLPPQTAADLGEVVDDILDAADAYADQLVDEALAKTPLGLGKLATGIAADALNKAKLELEDDFAKLTAPAA